MRVLDIGCGVGDVSLLAGRLVGPQGLVLGIDRSAVAIEMAERRAIESGQCYWTRFATGDIDNFTANAEFDAVIGRLILMYFPDPAATLSRLARFLRPGGRLAFQELAQPFAAPMPGCPSLCSQDQDWIADMMCAAELQIDLGGKLPTIFAEAGLPRPHIRTACLAASGPDSPMYDSVAGIVRSLLPIGLTASTPRATETNMETLAARLRSEAVQRQLCIMLPLVGAWASTPE